MKSINHNITQYCIVTGLALYAMIGGGAVDYLESNSNTLNEAIITNEKNNTYNYSTGDTLWADYAIPCDVIITDGEGLNNALNYYHPSTDAEICNIGFDYCKEIN
jgi:hypothetical protein